MKAQRGDMTFPRPHSMPLVEMEIKTVSVVAIACAHLPNCFIGVKMTAENYFFAVTSSLLTEVEEQLVSNFHPTSSSPVGM